MAVAVNAPVAPEVEEHLSLARVALLIAYFAVLAFAVYAPVLRAQFVWDDLPLIVENENAHGISKAVAQLFQPFWNDDLKADTKGYFRPVIALSYAVDWAISGGSATWFHLVNVLVHSLNALLLTVLLLKRKQPLLAAIALATLFLVTARSVEDVAWISGRTDVFATFFVLLSFLALERNRWALAAVLCGFALGCKESAIGAVLAIGFLAIFSAKKNVKAVVWLVLVCGAYAALRQLAGTPSIGIHLSLEDRVTTIGHAVANSALAMVTPMQFRLDYPALLTQSTALSVLGLGVAVALLSGLLFVLRRFSADKTRVFFAVCGATAFMLPTHILLMPYDRTGADRFLYLPLLAGLMFLGTFKIPHVLTGLIAVLAIPSGWAAHGYAQEWNSELMLWTANANRGPGSETVSGNVGDAFSVAFRCEEALDWYVKAEQQAVETEQRLHRPEAQQSRARSMHGRAKCLEQLGRYAEAIALLTEVTRFNPEWKRPKFNLVLAYARHRDFDSAQRELEKLTAQFPSDARLAAMQKGITAAIAERKHIEILPGDAVSEAELNYSLEQGESAEALQVARRILKETLATVQGELRLKALATLVDRAPFDEATAAAESAETKAARADITDAFSNRLADRFADKLRQ